LTELSVTRFKSCPRCGLLKPGTRDFFYGRKGAKDGLQNICIGCTRGRASLHQARYPELAQQRKRRWIAQHPARRQQQARANYERNKERYTANARARREQMTPEERRAKLDREQARRDANKEVLREYYRRYYAENKEHYNQRVKQWRDQHPEYAKATKARRRAHERAAEGSHTFEDIRALFERQGGRCHYCRVELGGKFEVDHLTPLSRGGSNAPDNLACACVVCNRRKYNRTEAEFLALLECQSYTTDM
jgi:5-methylcytosine-specific restriction endonuclease McrA